VIKIIKNNLGKIIFICIFGITGWSLLTYFVWMAFLYGGQEGYVLLAFNLLREMIIELFLITEIFILMIIYSIKVLSDNYEDL